MIGTPDRNGLLKLITRVTPDNSHLVCSKGNFSPKNQIGFSLMTVLIDIGMNRYAHEFKDVFKR
jgi:hypothetical protein